MDDGRVCFDYPQYLRYETRQALNLHWPALLPVAALGLLPDSISFRPSEPASGQVARMIVTVLVCGGVWWLIGRWAERLRSGRRLALDRRRGRTALTAGVATIVPFALFLVQNGMRSKWHGPTMTDAGFVMPVFAGILALIELQVLPRMLRPLMCRLAVAGLLGCGYLWADAVWQEEERTYAAIEQKHNTGKGAGGEVDSSFLLPFSPSPEVLEGLAVHGPAAMIAELTTVRWVRFALVLGYWAGVLSLLAGVFPFQHRAYVSVRPVLRGVLALICAVAPLGWLIGSQAHGAMPPFGLVMGTLIPIFALRRVDGRVSER